MSANLPCIASASPKESPLFQLDTECRSRQRDHGDGLAVPVLADQGRRGCRFDAIVGKSPALWTVLKQVERVAPTNSTLLIQGETGTGKELIAQAVHSVSSRSGRPFIKLNCAAIPFDLLESELFGHEKGAFTGAIAQKIGRFEMADTGTLFLDEVGDIPLPLQPKLLRVLQEQEFERLGSGRTHKVNIRLVAATNRNLLEMVSRNEFRRDLYYRLNVFPIALPPLRARQEDIPELVTHFVEIFSQRMRKDVDYVPAQTMEAFTSYSWPGNIRELQNLIERAVILANDKVLPNPLPATEPAIAPCAVASAAKNSEPTSLKTLRDSARDLILQTLDASGWVVGGSKGAATKLGLKRTTLIDKMKNLGIQRPAQLAHSPDANRFRKDWRPLRQPRRPKSRGQCEEPQEHSLSG